MTRAVIIDSGGSPDTAPGAFDKCKANFALCDTDTAAIAALTAAELVDATNITALQSTVAGHTTSINALNVSVPIIQSKQTTDEANIVLLQQAVAGLGAGSSNLYLSVYPGIDTTGLADSRTALIAAMAAVAGTNRTLIVDCLCYIAIGNDHTKAIFVAANTNLTFTSAGAFITDNMGVPTFAHMTAGASNCTWTNYTLRYIGNPGSTMLANGGPWATNNGNWNTVTLTNWLTANNGNTFSGGATAIWSGPTQASAVHYFGGNVSNVNFVGNCSATAVYATADRFIPCLFSLQIQWLPGAIPSGLTINSTTAAQPSNISWDGFTVDGTLMGWVGTGANLKLRNITSFRYGDLEDSAGNNPGGTDAAGRSGHLTNSLWFAPPHLFYLQANTASFLCSLDFLNILDEGIYTTNSPLYGYRRSRFSGFIQTFKIDPTSLNTFKNIVSKRPDGFADIVGNGFAGVGAFLGPVDIALDCGVGMYALTCSGAGIGATSFTITGANWPANNLGGSYTGVGTGTYMTQFSTGELRSVTYTVTIVGGNATTVAAAWTQPLLNTNTTLIRMGLTGAFAFRFPGTQMTDVFFKNVTILDTATLPLNHPILTDASVGHVNFHLEASVIVQDYPTIATYSPGFGVAGEGINIKCKTMYLNCSSTQTLRGPIVNNTSGATFDHFAEHELHGWRQTAITFAVAPTGTSANLISACWQTGVVGWIYPNGTYNVIFSDGQVRAVTFTLGSVACTWTGALSGTPTVTASACLVSPSGSAFDNFKPRLELAQTASRINYGTRAEIIDVSNGVRISLAQGRIDEYWDQVEQFTPAAAATYTSFISYPTTFAIDRFAWGIFTNFGTIASINAGLVAGSATALATGLAVTTAAGPKPMLSPVAVTGAVLLTPNVNFDGTGIGVIMTRGVRSLMGLN